MPVADLRSQDQLEKMNDLTVRLIAPEFAVERQPIPIAIVIENTSDKPLDLHLQGREITFDITVTGEGGRLVWRRSEGVTQAILRLETLAPAGSIRLEDVWDQTDAAGHSVETGFYTLQGMVPTDGPPLFTQGHLLQITES